MSSNPYEVFGRNLPEAVAKPEKSVDRKIADAARNGWLAPLFGLLTAMVAGIIFSSGSGSNPDSASGVVDLGMKIQKLIPGLIFMGSVLIGLGYSIYGLMNSRRHSGVLGHAVAGLLLNSLLAVAIFGMIYMAFEMVAHQRSVVGY